MRRLAISLLWLSMLTTAMAQQRPWQEMLRDVMTVEDSESEAWEDTYELLADLADNPLDLNQATREELEQLSFLTAQQVEELVEYLYRHRPMKTLNELRMLTTLDAGRRELLACFVTLSGEEEEAERFPSLDAIGKYGQHELMGYGRVPFYQRRGDRNGYLGYPYKHWLRYQLTFGDRVKAGVVGSQDAGEPFFANNNRAGYDYYSPYLQLRRLGPVQTAVVGCYKVSMGMGLVVNNSFGLGKLATLQSLGRQGNMLRAHSSRSASDYFQGAAATVRLARGLEATTLLSHRALDATLADSGTATTLVTSGYHRTITEMEKKGNTHATEGGLHLALRHQGLHIGTTALYTHLDRPLRPNTATLYRRHYAQGSDFLNLSTDYGYTSARLSLNGETAIDRHGAMATLNSLSLTAADGLRLMALQRFYSYRYTALHARSFSEGTQVQNESGVYIGADWVPSPTLQVQAYADVAYFAWARYQVSQSSYALDHLVSASLNLQRWTLKGRYRLHLRQRDGADDSQPLLEWRTEHRARLAATYKAPGGATLTTQGDYALTRQRDTARGWMLSQQAHYAWGPLQMNASLSYFDTDSYDSRVYTYEHSPLHTFAFPVLYGQGVRCALMLRADVGRRLMLCMKLGITDYLDRTTVGSGLQQIDGSSQTDLDVQVRWKL